MGDTAELVIEANGPAIGAGARGRPARAAPGHPAVRAGRARPVLRSRRGRGPAQPGLRVRHEGARLAAARLGRPLFPSSGRGRGHPHRLQARQRLDRHRPAARHGRGHRRHAGRDRAACSGAPWPGWSTGSPSSTGSSCSRRIPPRPRTSASCCSRCPRTSACSWSSSPTACTTCARCISSRARTSAAASPPRPWRSTRRWPSGSAWRG